MTNLLKKRSIVIIIIAIVLILLPVNTSCGVIGYTCRTPPDSQGRSVIFYEVEPLGIKIVELFLQRNLGVFYASGVSYSTFNK